MADRPKAQLPYASLGGRRARAAETVRHVGCNSLRYWRRM